MSSVLSLCGIKHAGKTSVAKALAELTGFPWTDSDDAILALWREQTGLLRTVREIYRTLGEPEFRKLEMRALRGLFSSEKKQILALGGGVLSNPFFTKEDRTGLGFLCCLEVPDEVAFQRIIEEGLPPFLQSAENPFAVFCEQNLQREQVFRQYADLILPYHPGESPEEAARRILQSASGFKSFPSV